MRKRKYSNEKCDACKFDHYDKDQVKIHIMKHHKFKLCLQCDDTVKNMEALLKETFCLKAILKFQYPDITDQERYTALRRYTALQRYTALHIVILFQVRILHYNLLAIRIKIACF